MIPKWALLYYFAGILGIPALIILNLAGHIPWYQTGNVSGFLLIVMFLGAMGIELGGEPDDVP